MDENGKMQIIYYFETHTRVSNRDLSDPNHDRLKRSSDLSPLQMLEKINAEMLEVVKSGLIAPEGLSIGRTSGLEVSKFLTGLA